MLSCQQGKRGQQTDRGKLLLIGLIQNRPQVSYILKKKNVRARKKEHQKHSKATHGTTYKGKIQILEEN